MRTILLSILFALNAMVAGAQTQQGYVKTKNPLALVLEDKAQQAADLKAVERRISSNLYAKAEFERGNDELAQRCYSKYQIFKLQHQNDSAAFYLEERARNEEI